MKYKCFSKLKKAETFEELYKLIEDGYDLILIDSFLEDNEDSICLKNSSYYYTLGYCQYLGLGYSIDHREAFINIVKSAKLNNERALNALGFFYYKGFIVKKDFKEAFSYFKKAARNGYISAIYNLGYCYQKGIGVEKNYKKAIKWYDKASSKGHLKSSNKIYNIVKRNPDLFLDYENRLSEYKKTPKIKSTLYLGRKFECDEKAPPEIIMDGIQVRPDNKMHRYILNVLAEREED